MPDKEQITMTFSGYDDTNDNTVMFEGPFNVWKTVNNVDNLHYLDLSEFKIGDSIIVFVRNINKEQNPEKPLTGEIPYRGSFFKYDWDTSGWQQIALGNHSHANMELLDQIGEIDTNVLTPGTKRVLTLEKLDTDHDSDIRTSDYKLNFEEQRALPEVPYDAYGKGLYLSADKDGHFKWTNSFAPAQTFKLLKIKVTNFFFLPEDKEKKSVKTILLNSYYLNENNVLFNTDLHDDVLVFDDGDLVSDLKTKYDIDKGLYLTINNEEESQTFDIDEKITVLIIRDGISGIVDSLSNQYITKDEAIKLFTDGVIDLSTYVTKKDLRDYAAKLSHHHSQYIRKDDYSVFDYRYADYQHTHAMYVTKEQVLAIILDLMEDTGEINPETAFQDIINKINQTLEDFDKKFITKDYAMKYVASEISKVTNSDAINVTLDGRTLTDYLQYLDNKEVELAILNANKVELNAFDVQVGENQSIGGYTTGETIQKGTSLSEFLKKLVQKEIPPTLLEPEIKYDYYLTNNDTGSDSILHLTPHFINNDAGDLVELSLIKYASEEKPETPEIMIINNDEEISIPLTMVPFKDNGQCYNIEISASYKDGQIHSNNLNNGKEYLIKAGSKSVILEIYTKRKYYIGSLPFPINYDKLNGDTIHQYAYEAEVSPLLIRSLTKDIMQNGLKITYAGNSGVRSLICAIPQSEKIGLVEAIFLNQNIDIISDVRKKDNVLIPDASNNINDLINNAYSIYYFTFTKDLTGDAQFKLVFKNIGIGD